MQRIKDRMMVPRGLYDYTVPETGIRFESHGFGALVVKVRTNYTDNSLPVPQDLNEIIEADWCKRRPELCEDGEARRPRFTTNEEWGSLKELIAKVAIGGADALSRISSALGINCAKCQRRHRIISEMRRLGFAETVRRLKETLT